MKNNAAQREEEVYEQVAKEIAAGVRRDGLWVKALANSSGSPDMARSLYLQYRVQSLLDQDPAEPDNASTLRSKSEIRQPLSSPSPQTIRSPIRMWKTDFLVIGAIVLVLLGLATLASW